MPGKGLTILQYLTLERRLCATIVAIETQRLDCNPFLSPQNGNAYNKKTRGATEKFTSDGYDVVGGATAHAGFIGSPLTCVET